MAAPGKFLSEKTLMLMLGIVDQWDSARGFGFINTEGKHYFIHTKDVATDINGLKILNLWDKVRFEIVPNSVGGCAARVIEILEPVRKPVAEPVPREIGRIVSVNSFAFVTRGAPYHSSTAWVHPRIVRQLHLRPNDWIDYQPVKPKKLRVDAEGRLPLWFCEEVRRSENPSDALWEQVFQDVDNTRGDSVAEVQP
jgi:cold shock CspA family protein